MEGEEKLVRRNIEILKYLNRITELDIMEK